MSDINIAKPYLSVSYLEENSLVAVGTKELTLLGMVDSDCEYVQIYTDNMFATNQFISYMPVDVFEPFNDILFSNCELPSLYSRNSVFIEPIMYGGDEMKRFFIHNKNIVLIGPARENRFINYCHRALTFFGIDSILPLSASAHDLTVSSPGFATYFKGIQMKRIHEIEDARIDNAGFVLSASTTPIGVNTQREVDYAMSKEIPGFNLSTFTAAKDKAFREIDVKGGDQND